MAPFLSKRFRDRFQRRATIFGVDLRDTIPVESSARNRVRVSLAERDVKFHNQAGKSWSACLCCS